MRRNNANLESTRFSIIKKTLIVPIMAIISTRCNETGTIGISGVSRKVSRGLESVSGWYRYEPNGEIKLAQDSGCRRVLKNVFVLNTGRS